MPEHAHSNTVQKLFQPNQGDSGSGNVAYRHTPGNTSRDGDAVATKPGILFCGGFHSNMDGGKAEFLDTVCTQRGISFTRFDYRGHGQSDGDFAAGTIGDWYCDAQLVFDRVCTGDQIVVGSSMGAWMALKLAQDRGARVRGLVLIAPAPDFPRKLMLEQLPTDALEALEKDRVWYRPSEFEEDPYPITQRLIDESAAQEVLDGPKIAVNGPVHILHGTADEVVPLAHAQRTAQAISANSIELEVIDGGDHRLSEPDNLQALWKALAATLGLH